MNQSKVYGFQSRLYENCLLPYTTLNLANPLLVRSASGLVHCHIQKGPFLLTVRSSLQLTNEHFHITNNAATLKRYNNAYCE